MTKSAVISGVSSGIGYDAARYLVEQGWQVFGSVRKAADGQRVREALGENFRPLLFDVTDDAAVLAAADEVAAALEGRGLDGLVNNAGIAVPGPLMHLTLDELRQQLAVNVTGVLAVTQAFLPLLGASRQQTAGRKGGPQPGRIVNIGSVSGTLTYPFVGPYAISKHGLEAMSDALRQELAIYGIKVVQLQIGSVHTPIWEKTASADVSRLDGTDYAALAPAIQQIALEGGRDGLPVEKASRLIHKALTHPRPRPRYVLVKQRLIYWDLLRLLPDRWFDWLVAKVLGMPRGE